MNHDCAELRLEVPKTDLAVLDGYCSATGKSRAEVIRTLLASWSHDKLHESMVVCRVAGVNPAVPEEGRK